MEDRLPLEPKVRAVFDEIGTYGGQVIVFGNSPNPWAHLIGENPEGTPTPIRMDYDGSLEPDMALDFNISDDYQTFTLTLREGDKVVQWRSLHGRGFFVPLQRHAEGGAGLRVGVSVAGRHRYPPWTTLRW